VIAKIEPKHLITKPYMNLQQRINAFTKLGAFLCQFKTDGIKKDNTVVANDLFFEGFMHQIKLAKEHNGWFTEKNVFFSIESWSKALNESNINQWLKKYNFNIKEPKNVAIIMAGNIPLVGFHDFLSGLGCRNVSKLFVPKDYNFDEFFKAVYKWHPIINEAKYANNYDYNKAVYLMSEFNILENGFLMIKEDESHASPIATLFYEHYNTITELQEKLIKEKNNIQCIVAHNFSESEIEFGNTQHPQLWDYADNIDTVEFLLKT